MPVPDWPAVLPQVLQIANYQRAPGKNLLRSDTDIGPAKQRRRQTAAPEAVRGTLTVTGAQLEALRDFHQTDLGYGALPFHWRDPRDANTILLWRFTDEPWSESALGGDLFVVSLNLEILP